MSNVIDIKSQLRQATLGQKKVFEKRIVEINNCKFEIRQPTIGQRGNIRNQSLKFGDEGTGFDMFAFLICAVVELTYVPGTDERVFSDEDYEELKSIPAGQWFDELTKVASELCNVKSDEVKKPSEKTEKES